ncbi:hypothetical protein [Bifidobacterium sp. AGR2158]|uniref:hypothetical protein n=1 Tax=Bifidobacterium sp. AGR2158 TaxID=1280675 RepID=UPI00040A7EE0|nr:hypothetical protein [Bifidobacterium sp. AGR2158]
MAVSITLKDAKTLIIELAKFNLAPLDIELGTDSRGNLFAYNTADDSTMLLRLNVRRESKNENALQGVTVKAIEETKKLAHEITDIDYDRAGILMGRIVSNGKVISIALFDLAQYGKDSQAGSVVSVTDGKYSYDYTKLDPAHMPSGMIMHAIYTRAEQRSRR